MPKPLKTKLKQQEFYCVKCRKRVKIASDDMGVSVFKNEKTGMKVPSLVGNCKCDTTVIKFIKHDDQDRFTQKYGKY
jgi:hypothetical protein